MLWACLNTRRIVCVPLAAAFHPVGSSDEKAASMGCSGFSDVTSTSAIALRSSRSSASPPSGAVCVPMIRLRIQLRRRPPGSSSQHFLPCQHRLALRKMDEEPFPKELTEALLPTLGEYEAHSWCDIEFGWPTASRSTTNTVSLHATSPPGTPLHAVL